MKVNSSLLIILTLLLMSCGHDTGNIDTGNNPDGTPNNPGSNDDEIEVASTAFYTHDREIRAFAVDYQDVVIVDDAGLTIIFSDGQELFVDEINYELQSYNYTAKLNDVNDIISTGDGLHIGTKDGHLIKYYDGEFSGFPVNVYEMKRFWQNDEISALWEWYVEELDFVGGKIRSEIELDEGSFQISDEWPCLNLLDLSTNHCEDYDIESFASLERPVFVGQDGSLLVIRNGNDPYEYQANFSRLPFNRFRKIEYFTRAFGYSEAPDKFWFDHVWTTTDNGVAYYSLEQGKPVVIDDDKWNHYTTENSGLTSNNLEDMKFIASERLVAYSNDVLGINYIHAEDGRICGIKAPSNERITQIYVDNYDLYLAQGREIYKLEGHELETTCGFE